MCIVVARRTGMMDRPGALKTHRAPVPYLGGVAVFAGVVVGGSAGRPIVLIPLAAALAVGIGDDRFGIPRNCGSWPSWEWAPALPPPSRSIYRVGSVCHLSWPPPWSSSTASTCSTVSTCWPPAWGWRARSVFAVITHGAARLTAASLAGALVGFLWYNRPPARIYLGDGGTYLLGASMTLLLAQAWGVGVAGTTGVVALALLAVPVTEVACAIVRRRRSGGSILDGDRGHPYDRLVAGGWSRTAASTAYIAVEVVVAVAVAVVVVVGHASMAMALGIDVAVAAALLGGAALAGGMTNRTGTRP